MKYLTLPLLKQRLGLLFPFLATVILCLVIFTLSRTFLMIWQWRRVDQADGLDEILISGLRIDIASLCFLLVLPAMLSCLLQWENTVGKIWTFLVRIWITAGIWLVCYMEVVTPTFILEYDLRPNRLFIEYLVYPKELFGMLWNGYKISVFFAVLVTAIALYGGWKFSGVVAQKITYPKWYWRPALAIVVMLAGVMGARSTLGHRPLNPSMVAFAQDPLINDLVLNSAYSVLFALSQMEAEASAYDYYPALPKSEVIAAVRNTMNVEPTAFTSSGQPTLSVREASYKGQPKNIVILLLESHGARYVRDLGGLDVSPNIDRLMQEGWAFTRLYATGTRSVRGIEALITGFPPTPARSTVKLSKSQTNFFTIAHLLKTRGYHTQFVYGGESHFDNMKSFFLGNGFTDIQDLPTFENPKFVGTWGACDEDLYEHAHKSFTRLHAQRQPFFSLVFSSSNHSPFEFPDNSITLFNEPAQTVENAVKYADYALGKFIDRARQSAYWNNTVFVAIADHDARTSGTQVMPIDYFHIPAVIFGGGIEAKKDERLVSQLDIAPTLLSLAGISARHPMIGHDLTREIPVERQRAMMQRDKTFAWMTADNAVLVLQPDRAPAGYQYNPTTGKLSSIEVNRQLLTQAEAHALWGSLAYEEEMYSQSPAYFPAQAKQGSEPNAGSL